MKINIFILLSLLTIVACDPQSHSPGSKYYDESYRAASLQNDSTIEGISNRVESVECQYENNTVELGIGIVYPNPGSSTSPSNSVIQLYNDSLLTDEYVTWRYYEEDKPAKPVCPKYFYAEYSMYRFVCLSKTKKTYKVLVNYDQVKYLPQTDDYEFETWEHHILSSFGIRRSTDPTGKVAAQQLLRNAPNEKAGTIKLPEGFELLCPDEIKGDWVKVRYDCFYNKQVNEHEGVPCYQYIDRCKNALTGWLKWKEGNKVLIDVFLMP